MKGLCYIVLILGFIIFFQSNPLYAVITIVIFIGVYLLFKSRSSNTSRGFLGFLTGNHPQHESRIDDLITLMMVQQMFSSHNDHDQHSQEGINQEKNQYVDKIKNEVLELFDEE